MQSDRGLSLADEAFSSSAKESMGELSIVVVVEVAMSVSRKDRRDDVVATLFEYPSRGYANNTEDVACEVVTSR